MPKLPDFPISIIFLWIQILGVITVLCVLSFLDGKSSQETEYVNINSKKLLDDWNQPFIKNIKVVDANEDCPNGWKSIFSNKWPGISVNCDCIQPKDII